MQTIKDFIRKTNIKIESEFTDRNPNNSSFQGNHYESELYRVNSDGKRKQMSLYFSKGYGLNGKPSADEVLNCLAMDSLHIKNCPNFEDWASNLGYDTDSRKAFHIFKNVREQNDKLRNFLGDELFNELLWKTELE